MYSCRIILPWKNHLATKTFLKTILINIVIRKSQSAQELSHVRLCNRMDCSIPGLPVHHQLPEFSSVAQSCLTLWEPMDCSMPGLPVHHQLTEFTHVHCVGDAIQPTHPLSSPSSPAFNLFEHRGHSQGVSSSHQVAKVMESQLQYQSFPWIFKTDFL